MTPDRFDALLPPARDEAWKYTPVRRLFEALSPDDLWAVAAEGVPGRVDADRDAWGLGPVVDRLAPVPAPAGGWVDERVHHVAARGLAAVRDRCVVENGARTLVERFTGGTRATFLAETEIRVEAGASLTHVRIVDTEGDARHGGFVSVQLGAGARYRLVSVLGGGAVTRVDVAVRLREPGAHCALAGLTVVGGERHADHHLTVFHDAPSCTSTQDFRALVDGGARSVFTGRVVVRAGADGADAAQIHRALLLSDRGVATARPQLEIHTDQVKASHGTAVGALDPEALFYLRQRGLDAAAARELLVAGFAAAIVDQAPADQRAALTTDLGRWRGR